MAWAGAEAPESCGITRRGTGSRDEVGRHAESRSPLRTAGSRPSAAPIAPIARPPGVTAPHLNDTDATAVSNPMRVAQVTVAGRGLRRVVDRPLQAISFDYLVTLRHRSRPSR